MYFKNGLIKRSLITFIAAIIAIIMVVPATVFPSLRVSAALEGIDILVESITLSPAEPGIGEVVAITVTVQNQGTQPAGECTVTCYVDDNLLGTQQVSPLPSGGAENKLFNWTAQAGTHTVKAIADSNGIFGEPDETNNIKNYTFSTLSPDLALSSFTWLPAAPSRNDNVVFTIVVKNLGNYQSPATNVNLYIDGSSKGLQNVITLPPNGSATITYDWAVPEGEHTARVVVDEDNGVQESDENNNETSAVIGAVRPDLVIPSITYTPQPPSKNDLVTFSVIVKNQGSGRADPCFLGYFVDEEFKEVKQVKGLASNESTNFTFTMTATADPHTLLFRVDYYNDVVESNEINNENSVRLLTSLPDIVVKDVTWTPANAGVGDNVTFTATIKNEGIGRAEASRGAFNFSGEYWGYVNVVALDAGQVTTTTFIWAAEHGELTVKFVADFDSKITEASEINNIFQKMVPIVLPDLYISDIDWSPINPSLGDMVTFTVTLENQGGGKANSSQLGFFIDDILLMSEPIFSLGAHATVTRTCTWQAQNGRHTFKAVADTSTRVTESDEKNNENSVIVIPYMADIIPGTITWSPLLMPPGSEVVFNIEIKNTGSLKSGLFRVTCFVDNEIIGYKDIENLEAGASVIGAFPWAVTTGSHSLNVVSDSSGQVFEIDEENNTKTVNLPPPDLIVQGITRSPENPSIGDDVTYTATVYNQGQSNSQAALIAFYVDGVLQETRELPEVTPSGTTDIQFTWIAESGTHTFKMQADSDDRVTEINETNNDMELEFETLTPDLTVTGISWTIENLLIDDSGNITITIKNAGNDITGEFLLRYLIDNDPAEEVNIKPIPAGENATVTITRPLEAGTHEIVAIADADSEVIETDESNNQGYLEFTTLVPDLVAKSITLTPAEAILGEEVTVNVNVENRGREVAQDIQVTLSVNGVPLGVQDVDEIEIGIIKPIAFKWTALEGIQEFQAAVDAGGTVVESNDSNNDKTRTVTVVAPVATTTKHKVASVADSSGGFFDSWWWIALALGLALGGIFFYTTFRALKKSQK